MKQFLDGRTKGENRKHMLILCVACLALNFGLSRLALLLHLPLYLDNIGSALAAALGGIIPGILVGFLTNLINGLIDLETVYYGSLTVLIAICSALYANRGYYDKPKKWPVIIITFALIGGGLGSLLTRVLYNFEFASVVQSEGLAYFMRDQIGMGEKWAQFSADFLVDLLDKTITVVAVGLILRYMPEQLKARFFYSGWRQTPLSGKLPSKEKRRINRRSLRVKVVVVVALATLITGVAVTTISFLHFRTAAIDSQKKLAEGTVKVVAGSFDIQDVPGYLMEGDAGQRYRDKHGYESAKAVMKSLMDSSEYIEYCYVYKIDKEGCMVVFDPDREDDAIGTIDDFDEDFGKYLPSILQGKHIPSVENRWYDESEDREKWLLTFYEPVVEGQNVYAGVDVSLDHIESEGQQFLARVVTLFFGFFVIILAVTIWLAEYNVILPINSMAAEANRSSYETEESRMQAIENIEKLDIQTQDEIENLYTAMIRTTKDMAHTTDSMAKAIAQTQKQSALIGKMQNGLILVLADMVESRDQNTGEHVRKTAAYTGVIMRQLKKDHIYEDQLTDEYIQDVMNSAPLHDVGKIQVPDSILNKPGKLTDEEFAIMKTHTSAGADIITSAMDMVSEGGSTYLKEARNLAKYHHEKWNGMGYPEGLKGEAIPLSARIMAVADVFDALVSKRSYKDGFPFEKAMDIIKEGIGNHFDPNVAGAFIEASDEVRDIMESQMMGRESISG
ncbi:MAG: HD domain-containing protein [Clostridia bacterium]|nr:HD domain-containing protein [Clostridia bacterium]